MSTPLELESVKKTETEIEEIEEEEIEESLNTGQFRYHNDYNPSFNEPLPVRNRSHSRGRLRIRSRSRKRRPVINEINLHFNSEEVPITPNNSPVISPQQSSRSSQNSARERSSPDLERNLERNPERYLERNPERSPDLERNLEQSPRSEDNLAINQPGQVQFEYPEPQTKIGKFFQWCGNCLRVKKGFLAEKVLANWKLESSIEVDLHNLSMLKRNQIRRLKYLVQNNRAYSLFYYQRGLFWKWVYWISSFLGLLLTGGMTALNMIYDPCLNTNTMTIGRNNYNVIMGSAITTALAIITFMDASSRRRQYEEAGDEYKIMAIDLYREAFFSNLPFQERDLNELIDEYSIRMEAYSKIYEEPPLRDILKILEYPEFDMNIKFIGNPISASLEGNQAANDGRESMVELK